MLRSGRMSSPHELRMPVALATLIASVATFSSAEAGRLPYGLFVVEGVQRGVVLEVYLYPSGRPEGDGLAVIYRCIHQHLAEAPAAGVVTLTGIVVVDGKSKCRGEYELSPSGGGGLGVRSSDHVLHTRPACFFEGKSRENIFSSLAINADTGDLLGSWFALVESTSGPYLIMIDANGPGPSAPVIVHARRNPDSPRPEFSARHQGAKLLVVIGNARADLVSGSNGDRLDVPAGSFWRSTDTCP